MSESRPQPPTPEAQTDGPCMDCGYPCEVWFAPNPVWNQVVPERVGLLCLRCFVKRAGDTPFAWQLAPETFAVLRRDAKGFYNLREEIGM